MSFQQQSRFGSSIAVVDINLDGVLDIAVGAPAFSNDESNSVTYNVGLLIIVENEILYFINLPNMLNLAFKREREREREREH